jgi:hypothetical protein
MAEYYKAQVTRGTQEATIYLYEETYPKLMETVDILYKDAKMDAVVLEMIDKNEYNRNR